MNWKMPEFEFRARKLFRIVTERDEWYQIDAICYFFNQPYKGNARVLSPAEYKEGNYDCRIVHEFVQYRRRLFIDLWFVTLHFQWYSKDKSPVVDPTTS